MYVSPLCYKTDPLLAIWSKITMEDYKLPLVGLFTIEQLNTLKPATPHTCTFCGVQCGALFSLIGCRCNHQQHVCGECIDNFYDSAVATDCLFYCPKCELPITDYSVME